MSRQHEPMFKGRFAESISFKFLKTLSVILFFSALLLSIAIAGNQWIYSERSLVDKGRGLASYISKLSPDPLIHGDSVQLDTIVNEANKDDDLIYAIIRDAEGTILTSKYASINYRSPRMASAQARLPRTNDVQEIITAVRKEEAVREISMPIFIDVKTIGEVTIGLSMHKIRHEVVRTVVLVIAFSLLAAIALGIVLFVVSRKIILTPIITLAAAAARLAKGDLSTQVTLRTTGEVKLLIDSFNRMAENLEKTTVSRNYMDNIFRSVIDTLVIVSPEGTIRNCNAAICTLLGHEENDLIGKPLETVITKDEASGGPIIAEVREKGAIRNRELNYAGRDGRAVPMLFSASPMYDESGRFEGVVCMAQDITEHKRAEEALKTSEKRFRDIADHAQEWIWEVDVEGKYTYSNQMVERILGYTPEEVLQHHFYDAFHPEDRESLKTAALAAFADKQPFRGFINRNLHRNGQTVWLVTGGLPLLDEKGNLLGYRGVDTDITERKRAEEEKLSLERQVQQAQKMESLGVLAGGIAHDFNNILMAVQGHADLALGGIPPTSPARRNLAEIMTAAHRASDLCRQMLAYAGKASFALERVGLRDLVEEMADLLKTTISKKAILTLNLKKGLPPIQADPSQIRQIVMNLIINASEAIGDRGGAITVSVGTTHCDEEYLQKTELHDDLPPGLYVHLEVTDTGSGMDVETKSRIFEPFFTTKFTGRGLGLAAVLGIIRTYKGALKVYSAPGKGTTFKVFFPALTDGEDATRSPKPSSPADWQGKGTILLVDDEESLLTLGARMLEFLGFTVLTAADGQQAVNLYRERGKAIDLVLMDLTMPHMDGAEAFGELRRLNPEVRVVLASGYSPEDVTSRFEGKRLDGVLQKPYTLAKLRESLSGLMPKGPAGEVRPLPTNTAIS